MGIFVFGVLRVYANKFKNTKYAYKSNLTKINFRILTIVSVKLREI